ncbi:MAG: hypothetical protein WCG93_02785 [Paludibacter sp.]
MILKRLKYRNCSDEHPRPNLDEPEQKKKIVDGVFRRADLAV